MLQTSVDSSFPLNAADITLARACLAGLLKLGEIVDKKRVATFPLAFYATRHWIDRAKSGDVITYLHHGLGYTTSTGLGFNNPLIFFQEHPLQLGESAWD